MQTGKWMAVAALGVMLSSVCMESGAQLGKRASRSKPEGPVAAERCNQRVCKVAVTVEKCVITVMPEVLLIGARNQGPQIVWEITRSPGYTFPADGIAFKPESERAARDQFRKEKAPNDRTFIFTDANTVPGTFHYAVKVIDARKQVCTLDPPIINEF